MSTDQVTRPYHSFLLRFRLAGAQPGVWHASLQNVLTGEWLHFADLEQLFTYITREVTGRPPGDPFDYPSPLLEDR